MVKKIEVLELEYLKHAKKISSNDDSQTFDNKIIISLFIGESTTVNNLELVLEAQNNLISNGFIKESAVTGRYIVTRKGRDYLIWNYWNWLRELRVRINKIFYNEISFKIFYGLLLFIGFVIIDHFAFNFYIEKKIYEIVRDLKHSIQNVWSNVLFLILSAFIIFRTIKRHLNTKDVFIIFIWTYFRSDSSQWFFWPVEPLFKSHFLYIDVVPIYYLSCLCVYVGDQIRIYRAKRENSDSTYLTLDLPLRELSEQLLTPLSDLDTLGRNKFANQIAEEIQIMRPYRAFAIGINGSWGSGKTSLIDLIIKKVRDDNYKNDILFVEFLPLLSKNAETLVSQFFSILEKTYSTNKNLVANLSAYSKAISVIEKKFFETEFMSLLSKPDSDIKKRYDAIVDGIRNERKLLVVKVDDLDRLTNNEIIDALRLIRVIANFPLTIYLVAYDKAYVTSAICVGLTQYKPEKYIDKVFNVEFNIPELSSSTVKEHLKNIIASHFELLANKGKIRETNYARITSSLNRINYRELHHFIENERDIIRFSNNLLMRYLSVKEDVDFEDFFYLELINYKYPQIYIDLYRNKDFITQ